MELCKKVRADEELKDLTFIIASSKTFDYNRKEGIAAGANDYWFKPLTREKIENGLANLNTFNLKFWGVRGTLPVPGEKAYDTAVTPTVSHWNYPKNVCLFLIVEVASKKWLTT